MLGQPNPATSKTRAGTTCAGVYSTSHPICFYPSAMPPPSHTTTHTSTCIYHVVGRHVVQYLPRDAGNHGVVGRHAVDGVKQLEALAQRAAGCGMFLFRWRGVGVGWGWGKGASAAGRGCDENAGGPPFCVTACNSGRLKPASEPSSLADSSLRIWRHWRHWRLQVAAVTVAKADPPQLIPDCLVSDAAIQMGVQLDLRQFRTRLQQSLADDEPLSHLHRRGF